MKVASVVIVGAGRIGRMHAEIFSQAPGAKVAGIVDRHLRREWLAESGLAGVPVFASTGEALEKTKADAAVIAASSSSHAELIREVVGFGRHILCEKPVAFRADTIGELADETRNYDRVVQIGFNRRFDPQFARARSALRSGELGRAYLYRIVNRDPKRPPPDFIPRSGGMLADFHVHDFDMLRWLSGGEVAEVYARGANLIDDPAMAGDLDAVVLSLKMSDGALAAVDGLRETNCGYDQRIEIAGERGIARAENIPAAFATVSGPDGALHPNPRPDFIVRYRESFELQARSFLKAIRGEQKCEVSLSDAASAMRVVEAAQKSLEQNRPIKTN